MPLLHAGPAAAHAFEVGSAGAHPGQCGGVECARDGCLCCCPLSGALVGLRSNCHRRTWQHGIPRHIRPQIGACWCTGTGQSAGAVPAAIASLPVQHRLCWYTCLLTVPLLPCGFMMHWKTPFQTFLFGPGSLSPKRHIHHLPGHNGPMC